MTALGTSSDQKHTFATSHVWAVLCELDAELREVFPCGCKIVSENRHVLLYVHDD